MWNLTGCGYPCSPTTCGVPLNIYRQRARLRFHWAPLQPGECRSSDASGFYRNEPERIKPLNKDNNPPRSPPVSMIMEHIRDFCHRSVTDGRPKKPSDTFVTEPNNFLLRRISSVYCTPLFQFPRNLPVSSAFREPNLFKDRSNGEA